MAKLSLKTGLRGVAAVIAAMVVTVALSATGRAACPFPAERWAEARLLPSFQSVPSYESVPGLDDEQKTIWDDNRRRGLTNFRDIPAGGGDLNLARPVGRLDLDVVISSGYEEQRCLIPCTAWLITPDLAVTNHHCLHVLHVRQITRAGIRFGYVSDTETGTFIEAYSKPIEEDQKLDYAILRLKRPAPDQFGVVTLSAQAVEPLDRLLLIGYPYGYREQIVSADCYAAKAGPVINGEFHHNCHTVHGNSGSPIFDARTGAVVAIHHEGGLSLTAGSTNKGIPLSAIAVVSPIIGGIIRHRSAPPPAPPPVQPIDVLPHPTSAPTFAPLSVFRDCPECPEMVVIPAGSFTMGSPDNEPERDGFEGPQHRVSFVQPFAVGKYAVTFAEWDACVGDGGCNNYSPSDEGWGRGRRPVINVSWHDAHAYAQWLSRKTGQSYRLPSEAEWEYVARAGTTTPFWWGTTITPEQANYDGRTAYNNGAKGVYRQKTVDVGSFPANPFGLYDMAGNVWQWVEDTWHANYQGAPTDGSAWTTGDSNSARVVRGGSWYSLPYRLRSANSNNNTPDTRVNNFGFRLARTLNP